VLRLLRDRRPPPCNITSVPARPIDFVCWVLCALDHSLVSVSLSRPVARLVSLLPFPFLFFLSSLSLSTRSLDFISAGYPRFLACVSPCFGVLYYFPWTFRCCSFSFFFSFRLQCSGFSFFFFFSLFFFSFASRRGYRDTICRDPTT